MCNNNKNKPIDKRPQKPNRHNNSLSDAHLIKPSEKPVNPTTTSQGTGQTGTKKTSR